MSTLETKRVSASTAVRSMSDVLGAGRLAKDAVERYLDRSCDILQIGNCNLVIAGQEHADQIPSSLELIAKDRRTKAINVEYSKFEVAAKLRRFPLAGAALTWFLNQVQEGEKFRVSDQLASIAKEEEKILAVSDIANGAEYGLVYLGLPIASYPLAIAVPEAWPAFLYFGMWCANRVDEFRLAKVLFNKDRVHPLEVALGDTEDARRVFVARGLQQLAREYQSRGDEPTIVLAVAPKAHTIRYAHYLDDPSNLAKASRIVKEKLYKLYPGQDFNLRQYRWADLLSHLSGDPELAGWKQISNSPL